MSQKNNPSDELPSPTARVHAGSTRDTYSKVKARSASVSSENKHYVTSVSLASDDILCRPPTPHDNPSSPKNKTTTARKGYKLTTQNSTQTASLKTNDSEQPLDRRFEFTVPAVIPVHVASDRAFSAFLITFNALDGKKSTILRRYRQFQTLHTALSKIYTEGQLSTFPRKRVFTASSFQGLEKRRQKLELYLQSLEWLPNIRSVPEMDVFLQEDLNDDGSVINAQERARKPVRIDLISAVQQTPFDKPEVIDTSKEAIGLYYSQVKAHVTLLTEYNARLDNLEKIFGNITSTEQFLTHHEYFKLLITLGRYLIFYPLPKDYASKHPPVAPSNSPVAFSGLSDDSTAKLSAVLPKLLLSMSEISIKLREIKRTLLNPSTSAQEIEDLKAHIEHIKTLFDASNLISDHIGFRVEAGFCTDVLSDPWSDFIVSNHYSFNKYFAKCDYLLLHCNDRTEGPLLIALKPVSTEAPNNGEFHLFCCTKEGNDYTRAIITLPNIDAEWRSKYADIIAHEFPRLKRVEWSLCPPSQQIEEMILDYEKKDLRVAFNFKFGVLLCLPDQEREEDMFNNLSTPAFQFFLKGLGDVVQLSGYKGFAGGLDTRGTNSTGVYSIASTWDAPNNIGTFQIMYHVSTMLPFGEQDQNLAKKRHIGNDIVVIVFQEEGSKPFNPNTIKSNYIQIIIVIQAINLGGKKWAWKVMLCSAEDVPKFAPPLPYPPIFTSHEKLCQWLLYKSINGELAAYHSKLFTQQFRATWKSLLSDLVMQLHNSRKKKTKSIK